MIDEVNYLYNISNDVLINAYIPFPDLYISQPFLRIILYIFMYAVYAGICGLLADVTSLFVTKRLAVYLVPFALVWLIQVANNLLSSEWFIQKTLDSYAVFNNPIQIVIITVILFYVICSIIAYIIYEKVGDKL